MKRLLALLIVLCMTFSLAVIGGCAPDDSGVKESPDSKTETGDTDKNVSAPKKDSIIIAVAAEPDTFYPYNSERGTSQDECPVIHNIYETLIKMMPDGSHVPLLATDWQISADGKEYTFNLRKDVKFSNGEPMTAEDVAFSLNTAGASGVGKTLLINYDTTEVVDEDTVVIKLTDPYAPILNSIASRVAVIIDKSYFEELGEEGYEANPVGTGPYVLSERVSGDHLTMTVNEHYWGEAPAYKKVTLRVMTDMNTQMLALETGEIDVLLNANIVPLLQLPKNSPIKYKIAEASSIQNIMLNCMKGPAADKNFRKAIQYAINKQDIIEGVYDGMAEPTDLLMTRSFTGRPDDGTYKTIPYDPEKAKEYLAASSYNGEEFMIATVAGTKNESVAQIIQGQLINIGINATVNALDTSSFFALVFYGDGGFGAAVRAGGVSTLDADGLYTSFNSDYGQAIGFYNMRPSNSELNELLEQGRKETDEAKRKLIYASASDIITEEVYAIFLYCDLSVVAFNETIEGVEPRALTGVYYFNEWY